MKRPDPSESQVSQMIAGVAEYLRKERVLYLPASEPLSAEWKSKLRSYFPRTLLDMVKTVQLEGARIPPPPFYSEAIALSGGNFPDFVHLASVTYVDVLVFNERIAPRTLFHALVHAEQVRQLGVETYAALYVRGFVKTRSWLLIPLEIQAFKLEARFLSSPPEQFSVEDEVKLWAAGDRES